MHAYTSNFVNFISKSHFSDVFCNNANQFILTCWTHIGEVITCRTIAKKFPGFHKLLLFAAVSCVPR